MSKAKYYIYRNLHTKTFSVKYKGKVIAHPITIHGVGVTFVVHTKGREKVLAAKRKNVHAYVVVDSWKEEYKEGFTIEVTYNPYTHTSFSPSNKVNEVLCSDNKIYIKATNE